MTLARSDNKVIASAIEAMKDLVLARGGFVHPAAAIEEQDGMMRVVCHAPSDAGTPLFRIPESLLVPTDDLPWSDSDELMALTGLPEDFSADRAEMLALLVAVYNASGKLAWSRQQAAQVLLHDTDLAAQLALIGRGQYVPAPTPAASFILTRTYSSKHLQGELAGKSCMMPLIDYTNHHHRGSRYFDEPGKLIVNVATIDDSNECFCNYGPKRDPISLALQYGFLDPYCPESQSLAVTLDFPAFGQVKIDGKRVSSGFRTDLPKVEFSEDGLTLSHFFVDIRYPHQMQSTIRLVMMASGKRRGIAQAVTERAIADFPAALIAENEKMLSAFRSYLATRSDLPLARLLADACQLQLTLLEQALAS